MQEQDSKLSLRRGCKLLHVNRPSLYYKPKARKSDDELCDLILKFWFEQTNKGRRSIRADLFEYHGLRVNHKKVRRLMKKLGIRGVIPKMSTSKANKAHYKYPYGLKNMHIDRANLAWCSDITYIMRN